VGTKTSNSTGQDYSGNERRVTRAILVLVAFFYVRVELCGNLPVSLLCGQLATNREALATIRTPPCDGTSVNFLYNN